MFDFSTFDTPDDATKAVQVFLANHGQELAEAALLMGGAAAEARAINCAAHLQDATRLDARSRRDLRSFHRLLTLEPAGDLEAIETWFAEDLDPESPAIVGICILTDKLTDLLVAIGEPVEYHHYEEPEELVDWPEF